jgi:tetratricopeptide (TPR) repeat protein
MSRFGKLEFDSESGPDRGAGLESRVSAGEEHWVREAERAFRNGEFEPALRLFARVLEHNPVNVGAWTGQVRALIELEEYREARMWADKALERFPQAPDLLAAKAVVLARLGEFEDAMAFSDASLEERGESAYVWLARGDVLLSKSEKQVDHCFDRARLASPGDWAVAWLGGRIRWFHRQFAKALELARAACNLAPGELSPWLLCGECQLALGFAAEARISFTQAAQIRHDNPAAREGLRRAESTGLGGRLSGLFRRLLPP